MTNATSPPKHAGARASWVSLAFIVALIAGVPRTVLAREQSEIHARRPSGIILLTGYEPFGGLATNTSWEVAKRLDGDMIGGKRVVSVMIPVIWEEARAALAAAVRAHDPDVAVVMGVAWWGVVAVESVGRNVRGSHPDNKGARPASYEIYARGPRELRTRLPVNAILAELRALDIPCRSSDTAGTYLCNEALYAILYETRAGNIPAGLLHLPRAGPDRAQKPTVDEKKVRSVTVDELVRAVRAALTSTVAAKTSADGASPRLVELREVASAARAAALRAPPNLADAARGAAVASMQRCYTHAADEIESLLPGDPRRIALGRALVTELTSDRQRYLKRTGMYSVVYWCTYVLGRIKVACGDLQGAFHEYDDILAIDPSTLPAVARSFFDNLRKFAFQHKARAAFDAMEYDTAIATADAMFAGRNYPDAATDPRGAATLVVKAEALYRKNPPDADAALEVLAGIRIPPYVAHARALIEEIRNAQKD